jgi:HlyD family secretion protein
VVQTLYVKEGDTVTAGAPVAEIVDRDTVTLKVPFHTQAAQGFYVGQSAELTVDGYADRLAGTVTEISGADAVSTGGALVRTVTIEAANPGAITSASTGTATVGGYACTASGPFSYRTEKTVYAAAGGDVSALSVREGDWVVQDQTLCVLDAATSLESARISLEDARLSLQSAEDALDSYTITSPISGTVIEKNYKAGDTLDATSTNYLAVIYDLSYLKFEMQVDETYIGSIQVGQSVTVTADALEGQSFTGTVSKVNINGTTAGGVTSYPVTVIIDDPGDLLPGMNVSADILVEQVAGALVVPVEAVARGNTVLIPGDGAIGKDGAIDPTKLERVEVTLGRNDDAYIEVTGGLSEGDTIVIEQSSTSLLETMMSMSASMSQGGGE